MSSRAAFFPSHRPSAFAVFVAIVVIAGGAADLRARSVQSLSACRCCRPARRGCWRAAMSLGRDMTVGLAYGARISLLVGHPATFALRRRRAAGRVAGYYGGLVDDLLMRVTEFFQIIPELCAADGAGGALCSPAWEFSGDRYCVDFLAAGGAGGARRISVPAKPRDLSGGASAGHARCPSFSPRSCPTPCRPLWWSVDDGGQCHSHRSRPLSFLGRGDANLLSWGSMIGGSRSGMWVAWWTTVLAGACIMITVLALNFIGDGLNDALNPRRRR